MYSQARELRLVLKVSCSLIYHLPEGFVCSIGYEVLINGVVFLVKTCRKDTTKDIAVDRCLDTAKCRHYCHMKLCRCGRCLCLCYDLCTSGLCIEEFSVSLDLLSHSRGGVDLHFIHPHGDKVGSEFLAIELYIHQPIVIGIVDGERIIDKQI